MLVPRAAYVRFPTGNPVGQPHMPNQQRTILRGVLAALESIDEPGTLLEMPYRWRRMPDEDPQRPTLERPPVAAVVATEEVYPRARAMTGAIESAYSELMQHVDAYREWLQAELTEEQQREEPDRVKIEALRPQLRYVEELAASLEGPAHDGLVRVSDRVVRIRHWEEGVFI